MTTLARAKTLGGIEIDEQTITDVAEENLAITKNAGWRVIKNWNTKGPYGNDPLVNFHWMDHMYMLRRSGRTVYCAEPYGLGPKDLAELVRLESEGWDVSIGQLPLWYPGRTTQIQMVKKQRANRD